MTCQACGSEKFDILKVIRNKRLKDKWVFNKNCDSRVIICSECGQRYISETQITSKIELKNFKLSAINFKTNNSTKFFIPKLMPQNEKRNYRNNKQRNKKILRSKQTR